MPLVLVECLHDTDELALDRSDGNADEVPGHETGLFVDAPIRLLEEVLPTAFGGGPTD
jgi:hypothetical protein